MSKGLEALKSLMNNVLRNDDKLCNKCVSIIEKELKALEILKNKPHISFDLFDTLDTLEEINNYIKFMYGYKDTSILTKEEYDLLKEVLKWRLMTI